SGTAGERVFLKAVAGTLAGVGAQQVGVGILKPNGSYLTGIAGYLSSGYTDFIDTTTLPSSGTYTVVADPRQDTTGTTTVTLYDVPADVTGGVALDGPRAGVSLAVGQNAALPFSGAAGQTIRFDRSQISLATAHYKILK